MLGKDLSEALGGIGDEKVMDSMQVYEKKRRHRSLWYRAAAVAATLAIVLTAALWPGKDNKTGELITAPGILKVYAYEMKGSDPIDFVSVDEYEMTESPAYPRNAVWSPIMSSTCYGIVITPVIEEESVQEADITFEITVDYGELYGDFYSKKYTEGEKGKATLEETFLGKKTVLSNKETIYWQGQELMHSEELQTVQHVYVDIIAMADGNIVGYAVFEIERYDDSFFAGHLKQSEYYPLVDGEFQPITREYVQQKMSEWKVMAS